MLKAAVVDTYLHAQLFDRSSSSFGRDVIVLDRKNDKIAKASYNFESLHNYLRQ